MTSEMPLPKSVLRVTGVLSAVLALSALAMCIAAVAIAPHVVWVVFGFELIMVVAGVIGLFFALGAFGEGQGLTLVCIAGVTLAGGFLSYLATAGPHGIVFRAGAGPTSMVPWFAFRVMLGVGFAMLASYAVLRRSAESIGHLKRGMIACLVLGVVGASVVLTRGALANAPDAVRGVAWALAGVMAIIGVAAAGHSFIRAFECGRLGDEKPGGQRRA